VGGGPAGLECARVLVERGHKVTLADAAQAFGGRLRFETKLPGLSTWSRVLDYRLAALRVAAEAELFLDSRLTAEDVLAFGCDRVVIATGSRWTRMLYAPSELPMAGIDHPAVFTPDDIAGGIRPEGPVIVFDFDNYVTGGAIAELLAQDGTEVRYVTPAGHVSAWSFMTNELPLIHRAVRARQVTVDTLETVAGFDGERLTLRHLFTAEERSVPCRSLVVVGLREPNDGLYHSLTADPAALDRAGIRAVARIGDALAPGALVHAVHSGHAYGREFDAEPPYRRDRPIVSAAD
jgi:dimethylamine/trimethylamine dehydrogenase